MCLTWPRAVFDCFGVWRLRGRSGLGPLVRAHAVGVLAQSRAALAGFLISQVQRRALLNGPIAGSDCGVDFQVSLSLVFLELSVVSVRDAAFVQALVVLADSWDLQFVGDVVALDLYCLWREDTFLDELKSFLFLWHTQQLQTWIIHLDLQCVSVFWFVMIGSRLIIYYESLCFKIHY